MKTAFRSQWASSNDAPGFSRLELSACTAVVALLFCVGFPALARPGRTAELVCLDHLRETGRAFLTWSEDHGNNFPWIADYREGGNRNAPGDVPGQQFRNTLWYQMTTISNELTSPKVLACPSDLQANPAANWSNTPNGGFLNGSYLGLAVSYVLSLDSTPELPQQILLADRNLQTFGYATCVTGIFDPSAVVSDAGTEIATAWTDALHGSIGNAFLIDGSARRFTTPGINSYLRATAEKGQAILHIMVPR